jgi:hypothetical protein
MTLSITVPVMSPPLSAQLGYVTVQCSWRTATYSAVRWSTAVVPQKTAWENKNAKQLHAEPWT